MVGGENEEISSLERRKKVTGSIHQGRKPSPNESMRFLTRYLLMISAAKVRLKEKAGEEICLFISRDLIAFSKRRVLSPREHFKELEKLSSAVRSIK